MSALCLLGFFLTYLLFVRTRRGQIFDIAATVGPYYESVTFYEIERFPYVWSSRLGHLAGSRWLLVVIAALVVLGIRRGRSRLSVWLLVGGGVGMLLARLLKAHLPLRSLRAGTGVTWLAYNSLPSGHTTATMSIAVAGILLARYRSDVFAVAGVLVASGVGLAVVVARWHNPSDVVAAYFMVGSLLFAAVAITCGVTQKVRMTIFTRRLVLASTSVAVGAMGLTAIVVARIDPSRFAVAMDDGRPLYQRIPVNSKTIAFTWMFLVIAVCQLIVVAFFIVSRDSHTQNRRDTPGLPLPLRP